MAKARWALLALLLGFAFLLVPAHGQDPDEERSRQLREELSARLEAERTKALAELHPVAPGVSAEVRIEPSTTGKVSVAAKVIDLQTGQVLAEPKVLSSECQESTAHTYFEGGEVTFTWDINDSQRKASYILSVKRAGIVVYFHSAIVHLE